MQEFSRQSTGMVVTYVEFGQSKDTNINQSLWKIIQIFLLVAVSIVDDARTKLICTLFHDLTDVNDGTIAI